MSKILRLEMEYHFTPMVWRPVSQYPVRSDQISCLFFECVGSYICIIGLQMLNYSCFIGITHFFNAVPQKIVKRC